MLSEILSKAPLARAFPNLLVGTESSDDAAVYRINDDQAIVATTDFFMPIVDDPYDFGRIAATNAISDVYAMGGTPIMALALVAMPVNQLPVEVIGDIVRGGEAVCREAGIPIAGGHTIDSVEPIYGLVVMGLVHPSKVRRNADAKPGAALADLPGVHAITDVTGFGLAGHALEIARGAGLRVVIDWPKVPLLTGVAAMAADGFVTGASGRNWAGYGTEVRLDDALGATARDLLTDPQTSGGLLVSCDAATVDAVLKIFRDGGFGEAAVIGQVEAGPAGLHVRS